MHTQSRKFSPSGLTLTALLLSAWFGCIGSTAQAADSKSPGASGRRAIQNDAQNHHATATAADDSLDEDCTEDSFVQRIQRQTTPYDMSGMQWAKLDALKKTYRSAADNATRNDDIVLAAAREGRGRADTPGSNAGRSAATSEAKAETRAPLAQVWEIAMTDKTLNGAIARWTGLAGWQLLWELPVDYAVEARTTVPGTFEEAVETVTKSMETAEIPMKAIFYKGNKVLRIVAKGVK